MASNYNDLAYIMELDYEDGGQLIAKARERQTDNRQWQLYCSIYPQMTKENFIPFEQFSGKKQKIIVVKTAAQIREEVNKIKPLFKKG